jgi:hypothetical protein
MSLLYSESLRSQKPLLQIESFLVCLYGLQDVGEVRQTNFDSITAAMPAKDADSQKSSITAIIHANDRHRHACGSLGMVSILSKVSVPSPT